LLSLSIATVGQSQTAQAQSVQATIGPEPFPVFDGIKDNVAFWKLIYTTYSTREQIFHDSDQLMQIYGIKQIPAGVNPWSRESQRLARFEKERYREILLKFSRGMTPQNEEEKRIYSIFGSQASPQVFQFAADNIRTQLGQADRFREGIIRSGMYMNHIKEVFAAHGLPEGLAYLPHVESSFDYKAYSKFGAAGVWQFMRSTGRLFMKVNYQLDERRDPIRSTVAAAELLKQNFTQLQSWPLAVTAYNHGLAGMQRAVRTLGSSDYMKIFNEHEGRRFGFASRNFYSEFLAAKDVAANYRKHFGELAIQKPIQYEELAIETPVDVRTLMTHFDIDKDQFEFLNLALRPVVYRGMRTLPKGYRLRLPADDKKDYQVLLASLSNRRAPAVSQEAQQPSPDLEMVQVQPGDSLWSLSQQLQVTPDSLKELNELDGNRIVAGQILKVPSRPTAIAMYKPLPEKIVTPPRLAPRLAMIEPAVQPNSMDLLKNAAPTVTKNEQLTKELEAFVALPVPPATPQNLPPTREWHGTLAVKDIQGSEKNQIGRITLEAEETLGHLAEWLEVPTQSIRNLNGFSYSYQIRLGQKIRIPLSKTTPEAFEQKRLEYHQGLQEDFRNSYRIDGVAEYTVKRGDTIWRISSDELDAPIWLLQEYNADKNLSALIPGDVLTYPIVVPVTAQGTTQSTNSQSGKTSN
jgi:membrane-bound lytic murein transglycosylase D